MIKYYSVDAFSKEPFGGNQAGVCLLDKWIDGKLMQQIASENNLAETAFVVRRGDQYDLKWYTPSVEIDLCGHATLATAFILSNFVDGTPHIMHFHTLSGILTVTKKGELYEMNFPARKPKAIGISPLMKEALGTEILEAHLARDLFLVVETEEQVKNLTPNLELIKKIPDCFAVVVTAKGDKDDFVSRFFAPNAGIPEDPVTGSSHSTLIPFWAERLNKTKMVARQLSNRGGTLYCEYLGDRVLIGGYAKLYLEGTIHV